MKRGLMASTRTLCEIGRSGFTLVFAAIACSGCASLPDTQLDQLRQVRHQLVQSKAASYCAPEFEHFSTSFRQLQLDYTRLQERWLDWGASDQLSRRIQRELLAGREIEQCGLQRREELKERQEAMWRLIDNVLDSLPEELPLQLRTRRNEAQVKLRLARRLWEQQDYLSAQQPLGEAEDATRLLEVHWQEILRRFEDPGLLERWLAWAEETIQWSRKEKKAAVIVDKYNRVAKLYDRGRLLEAFPVEMGWNALMDKTHEGDGATPEGRYRVEALKAHPKTRYNLALLLNYPSREDRHRFEKALRKGRLSPDTHLGGLIELHGDGGQGWNWTQGCVALDNSSMKRLYRKSYPGMPVTIVGRIG